MFGELPDGRAVHRIVLGERPGPVLTLLDLGATVHALEVAGADGVRRNVVLGQATPADYLASSYYLGGTIGRYANRISGGRFDLDGVGVEVGTNDRGNHLHGGPDGFDRVVVTGDTDGPVEPRTFRVWWLRGTRVVAGMHVNDWDAIDRVRELVGREVDDAELQA